MQKHKIDIKILWITTITVVISFLIFSLFDLIFTERYKIDANHIAFTWLIFWTHLSNLFAMIWLSLLLFSRVGKYNSLEFFLNKWSIKNLTFTFILFTGIVFTIFGYLPVIIKYLNPDTELVNDDGISYSPSTIYRFMVIFGTTLKHIVIPSIFAYLFINEPYYSPEKRNISHTNKSMILFIFPSLYFTYVILLTSLSVPAPYPVLDFVEMTNYWQIMLYLIIDAFAGISFIILSRLQFYWVDKEKI